MRSEVLVLLFVVAVEELWGYKVKDAPLLTKRPKWLKACKRTDPNINNCINDMFGHMFPYLAEGIPEINVDPFEPLPLDRVSISKGSGAITLTGSLYNMNVVGPSNSTPTYSEFSEKHWNFGLSLPLLDIKSQYNLKGNILVLPLVGHGNCEIQLQEIRTKVTTDTVFQKRENKEILKITDMTVKFKVGKMRVKFQNLFNGNKILGQTVNNFINQNAVEIIDELEDTIGSSLAEIFTDLMNNIFTKIPIDLWYLTDEQYENYLKENENHNTEEQKKTETTTQKS